MKPFKKEELKVGDFLLQRRKEKNPFISGYWIFELKGLNNEINFDFFVDEYSFSKEDKFLDIGKYENHKHRNILSKFMGALRQYKNITTDDDDWEILMPENEKESLLLKKKVMLGKLELKE